MGILMHAHDTPSDPSAEPGRPAEAWPLRLFRLALGWLWAMLLALAGLGILRHRPQVMALLGEHGHPLTLLAMAFCLAGALMVFMMLVADDLCPRAPAGLTVFLKTFCAAIIWLSLIGLAVLLAGVIHRL